MIIYLLYHWDLLAFIGVRGPRESPFAAFEQETKWRKAAMVGFLAEARPAPPQISRTTQRRVHERGDHPT